MRNQMLLLYCFRLVILCLWCLVNAFEVHEVTIPPSKVIITLFFVLRKVFINILIKESSCGTDSKYLSFSG